MFIPFDQLPSHARVWVYQSNRRLSDDEVRFIEQEGATFSDQWAAHGQALHASVIVQHNHFLIVAVDERELGASGCAIDSSVGFVRSVADALRKAGAPVEFFDRTLVAFWKDDSVALVPLREAKEQIAAGEISADAYLFNNVIATKTALEDAWKVPVRISWLARYLPKVEAS